MFGKWRTRGAVAIAIASIAGLSLGACASGAASGDDAVTTYIYAIDDDPRGLNATFVPVPEASLFSAQMLDPLMFISSTYEISPALAEEWELSDDGLTLDLTLREGVTWHDGEPFTAEDVRFNLEEIDPIAARSWSISEHLASIDVADDTHLTLNMSEPFGPLLTALTQVYMLPKHVYEGTDFVTNDANMAPIGTGPMMFDSYSSGESLTLVKNPNFWGGDVTVDRAIFPIMKDATARAESLFAGEIDQAMVPFQQRSRIEDDPNLTFLGDTTFPQIVSLSFNTRSEPLQDAAVRQAIYASFDKEEIADGVLQGMGEPASTFFPEALDWANSPNVDLFADFPRDVEAINQTLDDAGFPVGADGSRFTLDIVYSSARPDTAAIAELGQSLLSDVGITLNLVGVSGSVFTESVFKNSDFDLALLPNTTGSDPSLSLTGWYMCNEEMRTSANPSGLCDEQMQQAGLDSAATTNTDERGVALQALGERAADLMIYAPLVWFNATFPSANSARWDGQDVVSVHASRVPWTTLSPAA